MSNVLPPGPLAYEGMTSLPYINRIGAPSSSNTAFTVPTLWVDTSSQDGYLLTANAYVAHVKTATWVRIGGTPGNINSIQTDSGTASSLTGIIKLLGQNPASTSGVKFTATGNEIDGTLFSPFVGDFTFTTSTSAATRTLTVSNTDNTSTSSNALIKVQVGGTSSGDPAFQVTDGTNIWTIGIPHAKAGILSISNGALSTGILTMSTATSQFRSNNLYVLGNGISNPTLPGSTTVALLAGQFASSNDVSLIVYNSHGTPANADSTSLYLTGTGSTSPTPAALPYGRIAAFPQDNNGTIADLVFFAFSGSSSFEGIRLLNTGSVNISAGDLQVTRSAVGGTVAFTCFNSDSSGNTASKSIIKSSMGSNTGKAMFIAENNTHADWSWGLDTTNGSLANQWKLCFDNSLTTSYIHVRNDGQVSIDNPGFISGALVSNFHQTVTYTPTLAANNYAALFSNDGDGSTASLYASIVIQSGTSNNGRCNGYIGTIGSNNDSGFLVLGVGGPNGGMTGTEYLRMGTAGQVGISTDQGTNYYKMAGQATTIGANGTAAALTAAPVGYITVFINGTQFQIPYYNHA